MYINSQNTCQNCSNMNCKTCNNLDPNECLSCLPNLHLKEKDCVSDCGKGYYLNTSNNQCIKCLNTSCLTCSSIDSNICLKCEAPTALKNGNCVNDCGNGLEINTNTQECNICQNQNCLTCDFPNTQKCLSCDTSKKHFLDDCISFCPSNNYYDSINNICILCTNVNCESCDSTLVNCLTCKKPLAKKGNDCVNNCGQNMFIDPLGNTCELCTNTNQNCLTCDPQKPSKCTSCYSPFMLLNGDCVNSCGENKVMNQQTRECESCTNSTCLTCSYQNKQECLTCKTGLFLNQRKDCVSSCGDSMYEENQVCFDCQDKNCKQCKPQSPDCLSCSPPKSLLINKCVDDCGDGYLNVNNICVSCINQSCKSCNPTNTALCLSCLPPKLLLNEQCVDSCGDHHYPDKQANICSSCQPKCKICYNKMTCLECFSEYYNLNGYCIVQCPKNKFYENKILQRCEQCIDPNCTDCSQNANQCSKCASGYRKPSDFDQKCQKCRDINCQNEENKNEEYPNYPNQTAQTAITGILAGITILMIFLSPLYMLVSFFDLLQLVHYLVFINVNYSPILYSFLQLFNFANFEIIPNIKNKNSDAPTKFKYEEYDTVIFSNLIQCVVLWLISFIIYLLSIFISTTKHSKLSTFIRYYRNNYRYNIIIGLGFLTYSDIILSVFLQLYNTENMYTYKIVGLVCSFFFIFLLLLLNYIAFSASTFNFSLIKYQKAIQYFYDGLHKKKAFMNLIILLRKTLIIYTLVFKQDFPIYQSLQISFIIGLETTLMLIINPYRNKQELKFNIFGRVMIFASLTLITFMSLDDAIENINSEIRYIFEILNIVFLISLYLSQIYYIIKQFITRK